MRWWERRSLALGCAARRRGHDGGHRADGDIQGWLAGPGQRAAGRSSPCSRRSSRCAPSASPVRSCATPNGCGSPRASLRDLGRAPGAGVRAPRAPHPRSAGPHGGGPTCWGVSSTTSPRWWRRRSGWGTVPVVAAAAAGVLTAVLTVVLAPAAGLVVGGLVVVTALVRAARRTRRGGGTGRSSRRPRGACWAPPSWWQPGPVRSARRDWPRRFWTASRATQGVVEHALRRREPRPRDDGRRHPRRCRRDDRRGGADCPRPQRADRRQGAARPHAGGGRRGLPAASGSGPGLPLALGRPRPVSLGCSYRSRRSPTARTPGPARRRR